MAGVDPAMPQIPTASRVSHQGCCVISNVVMPAKLNPPSTCKGQSIMKQSKNQPASARLPAPVSLTPEQLAQVASDTGAALGNGGGSVLSVIIYVGGYLAGQL
jgi:hypothetical protein